ncbi:MAG: HD family phosphohydrolase [Desulfovibrionales bacterium]
MTKKENDKKTKLLSRLKKAEFRATGNSGPVFCLLSLLAVAALGGVNFGPTAKVYLAGEIAGQDIAAHENLLIEDQESTARKRETVGEMQPPVFDLSMDPFQEIQRETLFILDDVAGIDEAEINKKRWEIAERLNSEITLQSIEIWQKPEFAVIFARNFLPVLSDAYSRGVVQDRQFLRTYKHGIQVRRLGTGEEFLIMDFSEVPDLDTFRNLLDELMREELNLKLRARKAVFELIGPFLRPNLILNQEVTQRRIQEVQSAVDPVFYHIKKGEVVVRQGERVSEEQQRKLMALLVDTPGLFRPYDSMGHFLVFAFLFLGILYSSAHHFESRGLTNRDYFLFSAIILTFAILAKFLDISGEGFSKGFLHLNPDTVPYSLPIAGAIGLLSLFFPKGLCILGGLLLSYVATTMVGGGMQLFLFFFVGGYLNVYLLRATGNRTQVLKSVIPLTLGLLILWAAINLPESRGQVHLLTEGIFVTSGAVLSLFVLLAFSPIVEYVFGYTSRFKLMELMDLEQPLLQDLMVKAPGTYHHSLIVANLVEAGARAIGANGLLVKVAALYHDIGKLKNPDYFIENQFGGKNKHNKLAPSMSALILTSHVKKGVEMARAHKLGPEITDLIQQHHGTSLISFFYSKAKETRKGDSEIREEDFRYPGPKPQTKEAGLILLADQIEASSRTLVDPTPSRIKGHIKNMITKVYSEGQLDESELTLRDMHQLNEVFSRILTGIFHHRVEYPKVEAKNGEKREELRRQSA